ncbi:o-succinylbenzoate--CoA ligase [Corynebacterium sp.]|uniref:o-succinylbenzoate--CoA ligase n=1 Tax=Corynebacterium sp. TaxID=1720 RepID=UPI0026DC476E|nr:o-succinylbenzoate--CoA ligase [Corynebacterium sp.]MDO5077878.1 o-succinylbenzoate--CoA ligase [Corynebacterium sp.]
MPRLVAAISGKETLLPLPEDAGLAGALTRSLRVGQPIASEIALVVATSGSTGTPKGALLTPANLVSSADATHQVLGGEGQWLLALPGHHIAGVQVLVRALVAGVEPLALDVSKGFDVHRFASLAHRLADLGDRTYTSLVPMQLLKAMETLAGIEALRRFDAILIGGAPTTEKTRRQCRELGIRIVTTYGSSETSGGCVYDGRPIPGAKVRVAGGRVFLSGPMVAAGYRNHIPNVFVDGWYATQDSGVIADGKLHITGRIDAVIDSGGLKLHPEVLEQAILSLDGVETACVVGIPHPRLGQAIAVAYTGRRSPNEVIAGLEDLPRWQLPKHIRRVRELPLAGPGKVDRRGVEKLF